MDYLVKDVFRFIQKGCTHCPDLAGMFNEVNNLLDIKQDDKLKGLFVGISESANDGSFIIHHFLSHCLKNSIPVCFVALSQSFGHYNAVSQKFGTNLLTQKETHKLVFIEGLKLVGNMFIPDCVKGDHQDINTFANYLLKTISSAYNELKTGNDNVPAIIIDDISILVSLGIPLNDVIGFGHYLNELTQYSDGSLVLHCSNGKHDGDENLSILWNWICHNCSMSIEVLGLPSGYCKDVHGEILVKHRKLLRKPGPQKLMQYKLSDKNITMFAAGMSSAVL